MHRRWDLPGRYLRASPPNCTPGAAVDACTVQTGECDAATGACLTEPINCDDADPCTTDSCDFTAGCVHVNTCDELTVTINQASSQPDPIGAAPIQFDVTFSEAVTGFSAAGVSLAGSTVAGSLVAVVSGNGASSTVSVTGMGGDGFVVASVLSGAASNAAGHSNSASTSVDNVVTFDSGDPTVTINQAATQTDPTSSRPVLFAVTFSDPVTGFTGTDVSFAGSTVGGTLAASVSGSGASYSVSVTGMSDTGIVVVSIPAGAAFDTAGNPNLASTSVDDVVTYLPRIVPVPGTTGRGGGTVTVMGTGFTPGEAVTVTMNGSVLGIASVLGDGSFVVSFTAMTSGTFTVAADGNQGGYAEASLTVFAPGITLSPPAGSPGETVTVMGTAFPPGEAVTVTMNDVVLGIASVLGDGSFALSFTAALPFGTFTVVASGDLGSYAEASFSVFP